jgi:DNA-binding GntR family transcriptional regulator
MSIQEMTAGSRVDSAYEWLLAEITGFRIRSGSPLSENRIAAQLGVSRTPVREALQRLEKEGLVKRTDSSRFTVSQLTIAEVNDTCDLLVVLDTYVCRKAASKLDAGAIELLTSSVAEMNRAATAGERAAWAAADLSFHRLVNSIAGNRLVAETVKAARQRIQRFWLRAASEGHRLEACSREHEVLARAMIAKDYDAIEPAVEEHIEHMRARMLEMLESAAAILGEDVGY